MYLGASYAEEFASIRQLNDGSYIACGMTDAYYANGNVYVPRFIGNGDAWVVKLDSSGNSRWQNVPVGTSVMNAGSIRQTIDGGYVMVGFSNSVDGEFAGKYHGEYDIYVVKLDSGAGKSGSRCWEGLTRMLVPASARHLTGRIS